MVNKRLIGIVPDSMRYIWGNVISQWLSLLANIVMMISITRFVSSLYDGRAEHKDFFGIAIVVAAVIIVRAICSAVSSYMSYLSSKKVKETLREKIYEKLLSLGSAYKEKVNTSEIVQVAVEGVENLDTYFGAYLPQFFYAMIAPVTLFVVMSFVSVTCAVVLLICVPLIPVSIIMVQKFAKKLLAKYWGKYTTLGDTFLENLQGLTTLKIYKSDEYKQQEMKREAEAFRKITMRVLIMQLNSITIMDLIAYGGAALGVILSVSQLRAGSINLAGCLLVILLSADFFIPMRLLGSFFHIAMNGSAASEKIFRLLDLPEEKEKTHSIEDFDINFKDVSFSYEANKEILKKINISIPRGSFTSIVGESGSGKSTIAGILLGRNQHDTGSVTIGGKEIINISEESLMKNITYIGHQSYLFKGTVRDNLLMGNSDATDELLWIVLEKVNLAEFLKGENGLDTKLLEKASNLSGGQCQRLALARALLQDSQIYIFDEATSNIDVESENDIMREIHELSKKKTVILISHRLANVTESDRIYVMDQGHIVECGTHQELLAKKQTYERLWNTQALLENYGKAVDENEEA